MELTELTGQVGKTRMISLVQDKIFEATREFGELQRRLQIEGYEQARLVARDDGIDITDWSERDIANYLAERAIYLVGVGC